MGIFVGIDWEYKEPDFETFREFFTYVFPLRDVKGLPEIKLHHADDIDPQFRQRYYLKAWPGGIFLARYILDHPEEFEGKRVLCIGPGSGIEAIALAKVGAIVTTIDNNEEAAYATRINAEANGVTLTVLEGDCKFLKDKDYDKFDMVFGAEILYDRKILGSEDFGNTLQHILNRKISVYIADESGQLDVATPYWTIDFNLAREGVTFTPLKLREQPYYPGCSQLSAVIIKSDGPARSDTALQPPKRPEDLIR